MPTGVPDPSLVGYKPNVGCGRMLSQSPPVSVHFQPLACDTFEPLMNQLDASTFKGRFEGVGYGTVVSGVVGHSTRAPLHEQSSTLEFNGSPSQLKSPCAQKSSPNGGCAPR